MSPGIRERLPAFWLPFVCMGIVLRALFMCFSRPIDDDTWVYLELGHNLFHHGIYGMKRATGILPSLFRLPGYPIFLATFEQLFAKLWPHSWLNAVYLVQIIADLAAGLLLGVCAHCCISKRAGQVALALAMLCPFTAAYSACAMTECLSVFAVALGLYASCRALTAEATRSRDLNAVFLAGCSSAIAILLRPDGVLLFITLATGLFFYTFRIHAGLSIPFAIQRSFSTASIVCLSVILPLSVWTFRNWMEFHVFQPLAPRSVSDPGEEVDSGVYRWLRTWSIEYVTTASVYWNIGDDHIDLSDLPPRAFDSLQQQTQTVALIAEYNRRKSISPELDSRFAELAAERIRAHPIRYYFTLPLLRVTDMLLRPRTELFNVDIFWWHWRAHPAQTGLAIALGIINLFYVVTAAWAFVRGRAPVALMLGTYLVTRFLLLGTMENPEPRYTLECFPVLIIAAAAALCRSEAGEPVGAMDRSSLLLSRERETVIPH